MVQTGDSPAVARRRVRLAIREARQAKGVTQTDVAEAMEWSLSKVMRIENGEVTISQNDLRPLLSYFGVRDRAVVDDLIRAAKASKQRRQWWDEKRYHESLTPAMRRVIQYESEASVVRYFCHSFIQGRLQTSDYARAILELYADWVSPDDIKPRLESRIRRHEELLSRTDRVHVYVVLDESVLYRRIGGDKIMADQFAELIRYVDEGWMTMRVAPFDAAPPHLGAYELLHLDPADESAAVLYREIVVGDEIVEDLATTTAHRQAWERLWESSLDEKTSRRMLQQRVDKLLEGKTDGEG